LSERVPSPGLSPAEGWGIVGNTLGQPHPDGCKERV